MDAGAVLKIWEILRKIGIRNAEFGIAGNNSLTKKLYPPSQVEFI